MTTRPIPDVTAFIHRQITSVVIYISHHHHSYGIVKHRLGPAMRKIIGVGVAYLAAALVEGYIRVLKPELVHTKYIFIPDIMLVVLDTLILWWSFSYLIQTIKQMRMKHNIVKFNLYRHFSNILIIVVIGESLSNIVVVLSFMPIRCV